MHLLAMRIKIKSVSTPTARPTPLKNHLRKPYLRLAIAPKAIKFSLSLDMFFTSMTWKSSGEPGSMMI
jgi:hypothetical protein